MALEMPTETTVNHAVIKARSFTVDQGAAASEFNPSLVLKRVLQ
jgi:hypothetical protein